MSKVFFYLSLLKVLPMDFMAALENNLKRQPLETWRCTWIQNTRRANPSIKKQKVQQKKSHFLKEELFLRVALLSFHPCLHEQRVNTVE